MTYLSAEQSRQNSEPRELFVISINDDVTVYRHTSSIRDLTYGGNTYTAIAMDRDELAITMPGAEKDLILTLPIDHAFVRRWLAQGNPPRSATLTVYRQNGGETETVWNGPITSMNAEDGIAKFRVPSRAGEWMLRLLPTKTVGRECSHVLYETGCNASRTGSFGGLAFKVTTTVIYVNGRDVRVDLGSTSRNGSWAEGGELVHAVTGEQMTVATQTDLNPGVSSVADLRMQMPIRGLGVGDSVDVYAGCDHLIATCSATFGNRQNFGGLPQLPTENLFVSSVTPAAESNYFGAYLGGGIPGLIQEFIYHRWYAPKPVAKTTEVILPRVDDGTAIPIIYGKCRVRSPILVWSSDLRWSAPSYDMNMMFAIGYGFEGGTNLVEGMSVDKSELTWTPVGTNEGNGGPETGISVIGTGLNGEELGTGLAEILNGNSAQVLANDGETDANAYTQAGRHMLSTGLGGGSLSLDEIAGYRGLISLFLRGTTVALQFRIGASPSIPAYAFDVSSYKDTSMPAVGSYARIGSDSNPINALYDLFVNKLGISSSYIDMTTWEAAATTLYNESHGYSRCIADAREAGDHIMEILRQIDAALYFDETSSTFKIKLIRADYVPADLPQITKDNCGGLINFASGGWYNIPNKIRLVYSNADDSYRDASATARNQANAAGQEGVQIEHMIEMRGITNGTLAADVVARELAVVSRPLMKCRAIVDRSFVRVNPGDPVRVTMSKPDVSGIVFRVAAVDRGTLDNGKIALDLIQDAAYVFRGRIPAPPALVDGGGVDGGIVVGFG